MKNKQLLNESNKKIEGIISKCIVDEKMSANLKMNECINYITEEIHKCGNIKFKC